MAWDVKGNKTYEFEPTLGLDCIVDCYAMNVASERDIWIYYYTEFPLVHIQDRKVKAAWQIPVEGCHTFAVSDGLALFSGDYDNKDLYTLVELGPAKQIKKTHQFKFCDETGRRLSTGHVFARSESLYLEQDGRVYRADTHSVRNAV